MRRNHESGCSGVELPRRLGRHYRFQQWPPRRLEGRSENGNGHPDISEGTADFSSSLQDASEGILKIGTAFLASRKTLSK